MRKTKLEKGITLVALIITIVVLLILAVVSIGAVKNSGIIGHATNTSDAWKEAQAKENSYLEGYEEKLLESSGVKVTYTDEGVPVPIGFEVKEGTKDTGLVISDGTNEFVWIPVTTEIASYGLNSSSYREPDVVTRVTPSSSTDSASGTSYDAVASNLEKAGFTEDLNSDGKVDAYDFKQQLEKEFKAMADSVNKYGGFYVGRYEVSIGSDGKAQSIAGVQPANASSSSADTWYGLYKLCKTYKTSSVTSSMIWGSQYDAMMTFIGSTEASKEGRVSHDLSSTYLTGNGKGDGEYSGGITYSDIINNIYDLEGNVREWMLEASYADSRAVRGGFCVYSFSPSSRGLSDPAYSNGVNGSRLTLYVEL